MACMLEGIPAKNFTLYSWLCLAKYTKKHLELPRGKMAHIISTVSPHRLSRRHWRWTLPGITKITGDTTESSTEISLMASEFSPSPGCPFLKESIDSFLSCLQILPTGFCDKENTALVDMQSIRRWLKKQKQSKTNPQQKTQMLITRIPMNGCFPDGSTCWE